MGIDNKTLLKLDAYKISLEIYARLSAHLQQKQMSQYEIPIQKFYLEIHTALPCFFLFLNIIDIIHPNPRGGNTMTYQINRI